MTQGTLVFNLSWSNVFQRPPWELVFTILKIPNLQMNWIQDKKILIFQFLSLVKENLILCIGILIKDLKICKWSPLCTGSPPPQTLKSPHWLYGLKDVIDHRNQMTEMGKETVAMSEKL